MSTGTPGAQPSATSTAAAEAAKEEQKKRTLWDIILTATPVILTVLATLLASRSASEMTQAQYYIALATQNQSKAGDQWAFFQAKRLRQTVQGMKAERGAFESRNTLALIGKLPDALEQLRTDAEKLSPRLDNSLTELKPALQRLEAALKKAVEKEARVRQDLEKLFSDVAVKKSLEYLETSRLPLPEGVNPALKPAEVIQAAVEKVPEGEAVLAVARAIEERKPRAELDPMLKRIPVDSLREAIEAAHAAENLYDKSTDEAKEAFGRLGKALDAARDALKPAEQAADELRMAIDLMPSAMSRGMSGPRDEAAALSAAVLRLSRYCRDQGEQFVAARSDYDFRRYEREARFNQSIAGLYEVQVARNSWESDEHMHRKDIYLYGMLAAQAGVTVATFALAVRFRGLLWALALTAGIVALVMLGMGLGVMAMLGMQK
jgi:hypothetical protein